jgi:replicative DNA helicase
VTYAENTNGAPRTRREPPSIAGKAPPHDQEAEAAVLSAILLTESSPRQDRQHVLAEVAGFLRPEHFYAPANKAVFAAILALAADNQPIDTVTVARWLRDREQLAGVGGKAYLAELADETPATAHAEAHARSIEIKARRRAAISEMQLLTAEGYGDVGDEAAWLDQLEGRILASTGTSAREVVTVRDALTRAWTKANAALNGGPPDGGRTGLVDLDAILGPLSAAKVTTIGGYWGEGKSALGLQVALATAGEKRGDAPSAALVISTEMSDEELAQRALFMRARVDSSKMRAHRQQEITPLEWRELQEGVEYVGRLPLYIDDREATTPALIRASVRHHKAVAARAGQKLRVVVVDYLQLIDGRAGLPRSATRENEISNVARAMKQIAKGEGVHVVALAQLNDDANKRPKDERRPTSRDFRESKAIPMNSDIVILIHNPLSRERARQALRASEPVRSAKPEEVELIVDKYRGGRTGTAKAIWFPSVTLFGDAQP